MAEKTDNKDPAAKLELRRYFLRTYHAHTPPHVLDCCQSTGFLWRTLREEFPVASYWGLDLKPKKGRLKLNSVRVLEQPGWNQNVVDVDTYGSPWKHWAALLPNVTRPTTVFLTHGKRCINSGNAAPKPLAIEERLALGIFNLDEFSTRMGAYFGGLLSERCIPYFLAAAERHGLKIVEAKRALHNTVQSVYLGVHLMPHKG